jgi:hypothetical protein
MDAFQWGDDDIGRTDLIEHSIDTGDSGPIRQKQYKIPQAVQGEMNKQIDEMLRNGLIEESSSPWSSPVMLAKQVGRDGKLKYRFLADLRALNNVTKKDSYPLPRIDQALDSLGGAFYFTVLDMARGYFQVQIKAEDREKTAFSVNNKLYQWIVMTQGLTNAPATFSRLMNMVLNGLTYRYCLVYLDDTIIYSRTFDDHLAHLDEILSRIISAGLKLKPEKCKFCADEVPYLGFIVTNSGIKPDLEKVKAINETSFPSNPKSMLRFLGAANYYRDFVKDFSHIASPLYKMAQANSKFKSGLKNGKCFEAFDKLKKSLMSEPLLSYPRFDLPFYIQTDASDVAIGAVIGQIHEDGKFHPISFFSRHLSGAETNYSATERELLAIVEANRKFYEYTYARKVYFITDHKPLATMKKLKNPVGRIGRLLHKLQDQDFVIIYQPGAQNFTADWLSRPDEAQLKLIETQFNSSVNWVEEQASDSILSTTRWVVFVIEIKFSKI